MLKEHMYSVLVVSASDKFNTTLASILEPNSFAPVDFLSNIGAAKRRLLDMSYDIVIVNTPLTDEFGVNFAIDTAIDSNSGVLLLVKSEIYDEVTSKCEDHGVLTIAKPTTKPIMKQSIKLLCATRERLYRMEKKNASFEEKMNEIKMVNHAKWLLIENLNMTEAEAHRYIEKLAMDSRKPKSAIASKIISEYKQP